MLVPVVVITFLSVGTLYMAGYSEFTVHKSVINNNRKDVYDCPNV